MKLCSCSYSWPREQICMLNQPNLSKLQVAESVTGTPNSNQCSVHPISQSSFEENASIWLTAPEAAQYLKINVRTILLWARQGRIKAYALSGTKRHLWRFRSSELASAFAKSSVDCLHAAVRTKEKIQMVRKRNQHGSIRILSRKSGDVFEYRYYRTRADRKARSSKLRCRSCDRTQSRGGGLGKAAKNGL